MPVVKHGSPEVLVHVVEYPGKESASSSLCIADGCYVNGAGWRAVDSRRPCRRGGCRADQPARCHKDSPAARGCIHTSALYDVCSGTPCPLASSGSMTYGEAWIIPCAAMCVLSGAASKADLWYTKSGSVRWQCSEWLWLAQIPTLRQVVKEEGARALWAGVRPRVLFHVPAAAICWGTYETMKRALKAV